MVDIISGVLLWMVINLMSNASNAPTEAARKQLNRSILREKKESNGQ